jgi:hypothetical protein
VRPGQVVILDGGTAITPGFGGNRGSPPIVLALAEHPLIYLVTAATVPYEMLVACKDLDIDYSG